MGPGLPPLAMVPSEESQLVPKEVSQEAGPSASEAGRAGLGRRGGGDGEAWRRAGDREACGACLARAAGELRGPAEGGGGARREGAVPTAGRGGDVTGRRLSSPPGEPSPAARPAWP